MSTTQQSSKRYLREEELSREETEGSEPARSMARSKTSLKLPQRIVGIEGSILEWRSPKNWSPSRVVVRCVHTTNPKRATEEREFNLQVTTGNIPPRVDQRQRRTKQNNTTRRMRPPRRGNSRKTGREKPRRTLRR